MYCCKTIIRLIFDMIFSSTFSEGKKEVMSQSCRSCRCRPKTLTLAIKCSFLDGLSSYLDTTYLWTRPLSWPYQTWPSLWNDLDIQGQMVNLLVLTLLIKCSFLDRLTWYVDTKYLLVRLSIWSYLIWPWPWNEFEIQGQQ